MINETLVAAAQYMDEHGKAYGRFKDEEGRVCMLGAIIEVLGSQRYLYDLLTATGSHIPEEVRLQEYASHKGYPFEDVPTLNDTFFETKEETVKFMMEAAEWEPSND